MSNVFKQYTVVVAYPQRLVDMDPDGCPITYVARVQATNALEAKNKGRKEAHQARENISRGRLDDWQAILIIAGHPEIIFQE